MLKQKIIVLSASQYRITNDAGVIENEGTHLFYVMSEDLSIKDEDTTRSVIGLRVSKDSLAYEDYDKFKASELPGHYEVTIDFRVDSKGKTTVTLSDHAFLNTVKVMATTGGLKLKNDNAT